MYLLLHQEDDVVTLKTATWLCGQKKPTHLWATFSAGNQCFITFSVPCTQSKLVNEHKVLTKHCWCFLPSRFWPLYALDRQGQFSTLEWYSTLEWSYIILYLCCTTCCASIFLCYLDIHYGEEDKEDWMWIKGWTEAGGTIVVPVCTDLISVSIHYSHTHSR